MAAVPPDRTANERQRRRRAKLKNEAELALVRHDWALFLQADRLAQKAGCAQRFQRRSGALGGPPRSQPSISLPRGSAGLGDAPAGQATP